MKRPSLTLAAIAISVLVLLFFMFNDSSPSLGPTKLSHDGPVTVADVNPTGKQGFLPQHDIIRGTPIMAKMTNQTLRYVWLV